MLYYHNKTRFGSQGVIPDGFKQKNLMERETSPPLHGKFHFKFRICFSDEPPNEVLYRSPGLMSGTVRCVLWWKAPSYLDFIFTFGTARSRFTQIELFIRLDAIPETHNR